MRPKRYVIDLQSLQSASRFRGIGRYSLALSEALARAAGDHEIWLLLCGLMPEPVDFVRSRFDGIVPQDRIRVFEAPGPVSEADKENVARARRAEILREHFLGSLNPDLVYVSSLFEGFYDDAVTSIAAPANDHKTAVTLYDLIPLLAPDTLLYNTEVKNWYWRKIQSLRRADLLLAISESARREAIEHLGIPPDRVVNVSCGVDACFQPPELSREDASALLQRLGIAKKFVLYSGAADTRKNLDGLIRAFALLSPAVRKDHQLLLIGKHDPPVVLERLRKLADSLGVLPDVVFGGYVSDRDLTGLYSLCASFVLPSFQEGFGLPLLEAMACGAAAIGSNTTSIPEVVETADALFDPTKPQDIAAKLQRVLTDAGFRQQLREHGLSQAKKFTWQACAKKTLAAFENVLGERDTSRAQTLGARRSVPTLAYVSPIPPEKSGIADYSAELLPALARYYDIEVVTSAQQVSDPYILANFPVRDPLSFDAIAGRYDRILYQFGNSSYHAYMFDLLQRHPGTVVLHDFYLSTLLRWMEWKGMMPHGFLQALYDSHGYPALVQESKIGAAAAELEFPCNAWVLEAANGVIVHSGYSRRLADTWYGAGTTDQWRVLPFLRVLRSYDRQRSRAALGLKESDFVVGSFGLITPLKMCDRLVSAWLKSDLALDPACKLMLVGKVETPEYEKSLIQQASDSPAKARIGITGFAPIEQYRDWLAAADVAVQLRCRSRGESSAAVIDCLSHGVATVVNRHGSSAELPEDVVVQLQESFEDEELSSALERLRKDNEYRNRYADAGRRHVAEVHDVERVATAYRDAIEDFAENHPIAREQSALARIAATQWVGIGDGEAVRLAQSLASNRQGSGQRRLLLDVSGTARHDPHTGIQRVARQIIQALVSKSPEHVRPEVVHDVPGHYTLAREFMFSMLQRKCFLQDAEYYPQEGDIWLGLDISAASLVSEKPFFARLRAHNIPIYFITYDLLPILHPEFFPEDAPSWFGSWLDMVCEYADGLVCISKAVADELWAWLEVNPPKRLSPLNIGYFHLGAELPVSKTRDADAAKLIGTGGHPSILMVGTMEPRKGHKQALEAFELLWAEGVAVNLVIVGHYGWNMETFAERVKQHKQYGKRLFWLPKASDDALATVYEGAAALLAASESEGFGLPLIEAARYKLPIIARDMPVFREVAGDHAYYFRGTSPQSLSQALRTWLDLRESNQVPSSEGIRWLTWAQSAEQLLPHVLNGAYYRRWAPNSTGIQTSPESSDQECVPVDQGVTSTESLTGEEP